ncbi:MAG: ABC transporter permease, partial [Desulfatirhabdiaceae bacterium]
SHIADLKVGSPLQKTISGGQRKRLNIALELIREPGLLFVDEPTSGLSSADAENVMGLLREQAARDRLVIVVIHQPSSRIFRMFDALWILDQGGLPVFTGTPLEAIAYFRSRGGLPGAAECICPGCGDVNPAQIFDILESKTIDTDGEFTRQRRILPKQWRDYFLQYEAKRQANAVPVSRPDNLTIDPETERAINRPGLWGQMKIFFSRDFHARLSNRPYLLITLLEPPLLGLIIGLVTRGKIFESYSFHTNDNLHIYFFLSVIVAIFLGLSISAEEICRDRKILKRERFLGLSWFSYINSKCLYLGIVAMIQMLLYIGVANTLLGLQHMHVKMWLVLALSAFGISILGLNISSAFRSAVTIYILIPVILIPQMLLSGAVIRFEGLISSRSVGQEVPVFADVFFSRWGYEALVVEQYANNPYMRELLETDATIRLAEYELDHVIPELRGQIASILWFQQNDPNNTDIDMKLQAIKHEVSRLERRTGQPVGVPPENFQAGRFTQSDADQIEKALARYRRSVFEKRRKAAGERRLTENRLRQELGTDGLEQHKKKYTNQGIERLVLKMGEMEPIRLTESGLVRKTLPIYRQPESFMGKAHFLAREKCLGNLSISTYPFNLGVILLMSLLCYIALYFDVFSRLTFSR